MSYVPPSPNPPWARAIRTPSKQVIIADDAIDLEPDVTYLQLAVSNPSVPVTVTIADGSYLGQTKRIIIPELYRETTETFNLTGNFARYNSLTFNSVGFNAVLEWDGTAWVFLAGNAVANV